MTNDIEFRQSRFGHATRFRFGRDVVAFAFRDTSGEIVFDMPYEAIAFHEKSAVTINNNNFAWRLRLVPLAGFMASFVLVKVSPDAGAALGIVSALALVALFICTALKCFVVKPTIIPTRDPRRSVRVIQDQRGRTVLQVLEQHWRDRLRLLYGRADLRGDPAAEHKRLAWLHEIHVLDDEQLAAEKARLHVVEAGVDATGTRILN